ncbi:hypothetical protein BDR04DRAFT_1126810 [Suillus decipiens]|nr:hypothetical protein BDR04DRAFT_1126810 [Suillus decipiens]
MEYVWHQSSVKIQLPKEKIKFASEADAPELKIPGIHHHSLTNIITNVLRFWTTPDNCTIKVFSEAYALPALMEAYTEIHALPCDPRDNLECMVASLMPMARASHHLAYILTLLNNLQDIYVDIFGEAMLSDLMQAIWGLLFDSKLIEAYKHGIVIQCSDGITQRVFPQFFSYSVYYPEKVLLATIKFLGGCLCPCHILQNQHAKLALHYEMPARGSNY